MNVSFEKKQLIKERIKKLTKAQKEFGFNEINKHLKDVFVSESFLISYLKELFYDPDIFPWNKWYLSLDSYGRPYFVNGDGP